ncbi:MAG TPA: hypothetical protein VNQ73_22630 [Ilumatobacter sp.]|nr:hypothetical protein [Ilumatobacter sp.]
MAGPRRTATPDPSSSRNAVAAHLSTRRLVAFALLGSLAGCDTVRPTSLTQTGPTTFVLETLCAHDVSAAVTESAGLIRISDVSGRVEDGDCLGSTTIGLAEPLAERAVVVDWRQWVRIDDDCDHARYAPPEAETEWHWRIPIPCEYLDP